MHRVTALCSMSEEDSEGDVFIDSPKFLSAFEGAQQIRVTDAEEGAEEEESFSESPLPSSARCLRLQVTSHWGSSPRHFDE